MSANTLSSALEHRRGASRFTTLRLSLAFALTLAIALTPAAGVAAIRASSAAPPLPAPVAAVAPGLKVQGGGELKFLGISIYDGWYWSQTQGWPQDAPYALDLHYHRAIEGAKIAERSVDEIAKMKVGTSAQRARWGELMTALFPDVKKGDRLTGVNLPGGIVRFYLNGAAIGEIADPPFAQAFFGIWLDPKSSRADFRQKLLGTP